MNRRTFLQFLALLPFVPSLHLPLPELERYDSSGGQWVFDGVNGLTFPATIPVLHKQTPNATRVYNFRALTFFEQLFGGDR